MQNKHNYAYMRNNVTSLGNYKVLIFKMSKWRRLNGRVASQFARSGLKSRGRPS